MGSGLCEGVCMSCGCCPSVAIACQEEEDQTRDKDLGESSRRSKCDQPSGYSQGPMG